MITLPFSHTRSQPAHTPLATGKLVAIYIPRSSCVAIGKAVPLTPTQRERERQSASLELTIESEMDSLCTPGGGSS